MGTLRRKAEETVRQAEESERAKRATEAAQAEQQHAEVEIQLKEAQREIEELRKLKTAAEERAIEGDTARLQMQVERDKANALAVQLRADLDAMIEKIKELEQQNSTIRLEALGFQHQLEDMAVQIQVLTDERNAAQLREEDIFEQMIAIEDCLVDTTEAYLTDRLLEKEAEVDALTERLLQERRRSLEMKEKRRSASGCATPRETSFLSVSAAAERGANDVDEYSDDFDGDSDGPPVLHSPKRHFGNSWGSLSIATDIGENNSRAATPLKQAAGSLRARRDLGHGTVAGSGSNAVSSLRPPSARSEQHHVD